MPERTTTRQLTEFALESANRLSIRTGNASDPQHMWACATGAAAAWALYQALERLTELDPEGTAAFTSDLAEELEDGDYGDLMADAARAHGFDPTPWFNAEHDA
ncbi:hypothetical protein ABZ958_03260 [Streptomyces sp. NPDC046237]|uniref:hypothetical protein n=1 Tax=Streptomyces sp. NPDC046237 TaxID=3154914 RepID=UPI0033ECEA19